MPGLQALNSNSTHQWMSIYTHQTTRKWSRRTQHLIPWWTLTNGTMSKLPSPPRITPLRPQGTQPFTKNMRFWQPTPRTCETLKNLYNPTGSPGPTTRADINHVNNMRFSNRAPRGYQLILRVTSYGYTTPLANTWGWDTYNITSKGRPDIHTQSNTQVTQFTIHHN